MCIRDRSVTDLTSDESVSNSFAYPYEGHYLYSPVMNVESETNVIVRFQIALDGYPSPTGHYNGMSIEYNSDGGEWVTALNYEISAGGGTVDIYPRVESFYASMESTLQLRWETYGTNSYYIDAWHVDDVKVDVIPSISNVSIQSNNEDDTGVIVKEDDYLTILDSGAVLMRPRLDSSDASNSDDNSNASLLRGPVFSNDYDTPTPVVPGTIRRFSPPKNPRQAKIPTGK